MDTVAHAESVTSADRSDPRAVAVSRSAAATRSRSQFLARTISRRSLVERGCEAPSFAGSGAARPGSPGETSITSEHRGTTPRTGSRSLRRPTRTTRGEAGSGSPRGASSSCSARVGKARLPTPASTPEPAARGLNDHVPHPRGPGLAPARRDGDDAGPLVHGPSSRDNPAAGRRTTPVPTTTAAAPERSASSPPSPQSADVERVCSSAPYTLSDAAVIRRTSPTSPLAV